MYQETGTAFFNLQFCRQPEQKATYNRQTKDPIIPIKKATIFSLL
jgi:hypothetical protein